MHIEGTIRGQDGTTSRIELDQERYDSGSLARLREMTPAGAKLIAVRVDRP